MSEKCYETIVPVGWMPIKGTHEFTINHDGKTVLTIQQDCYDEGKTVFTGSYRIITSDRDVIDQLRIGEKKFSPRCIKILEDGEIVKAELLDNTTVMIDPFGRVLIVVYPHPHF